MPMVLPQPSTDVMKEEEDSADDSASPPHLLLATHFLGGGGGKLLPFVPPPLPFLRCRGGGSLSQLLPLPLLSHPQKDTLPIFPLTKV